MLSKNKKSLILPSHYNEKQMNHLIKTLLFTIFFSNHIIAQSDVWINEFSYDDQGPDDLEFIEVAGVAGTDLSNFKLYLLNGNSTPNAAVTYSIISLEGIIPNEINGYGAVDTSLYTIGLQNGANDGIALVYNDSILVEFISYEGTISAYIFANNTSTLYTSTDVGLSQASQAEDDTLSIQLTGFETLTPDATWVKHLRSPGLLNANQSPNDFTVSNSFIDQVESTSYYTLMNNQIINKNFTDLFIYDFRGRIVKTVKRNETVTLSSGLYIVKGESSSNQPPTKVSVR